MDQNNRSVGKKRGHTCLHTNYTLWDNLAPFLQRKATVLDDNVHTDIPSCQFTYTFVKASLLGQQDEMSRKIGFCPQTWVHFYENRSNRNAHFVSSHLSPFLAHPFHPLISVFLSRERNGGFSSHKSFMGAVKGKHVQPALLNSHSLLFISIWGEGRAFR